MKKLLLLLLASVLVGGLATTSLANPPYQNKPAKPAPKGPAFGSPEWAKALHNRVVNAIGLTPAQKKAINVAFDKQAAGQLKAKKDYPVKSASDPNMKKLSDAVNKVNATFMAEAKKALGPKYPAYEKKLMEEAQKEMAKMGMGGMDPAKIEAALKTARARVAKQMGLTAAQQKSIADLDAKAQKDAMALSMQMAGKDPSKMSKAEKDKMSAAYKKIGDTRNAGLKKLIGEKKAAEYDKKLGEEMQKEMAKLMPKNPAGAKPKG